MADPLQIGDQSAESPEAAARRLADAMPGEQQTPLLPRDSIAGRALVMVIAIMTYLASITAGTLELVASASASWRAEIASEVTIQLRPRHGADLDATVERAADIARRTRGIAEVRVVSKAETDRMLEPWLGTGLDLQGLAVPRLIVVKLGDAPDLARLRADIAALPGASLDDHRLWVGRLGAMANTLVAIGVVILLLVLTATGLAVGFATRGALAGNRPITEVLHLVGATDAFIANEYQGHFLRLGLKGGGIGAALAVLTFVLGGVVAGQWAATPRGDQIEAMFGAFQLGVKGYMAVMGIALVVALTAAVVSRATVYRNLRGLD